MERNATQTAHLIRRITNRHKGLRENEKVRILQAFVLTRLLYSLPYLRLTRQELERVDAPIRRRYKLALRLIPGTSTARFDGLGLHNTVRELIEAHLTSQCARLARSAAGRHILQDIGHHTSTLCQHTSTQD